KIIGESAIKKGLKKRQVLFFAQASEAARELKNLIKPGDLVLIKASRAVGLEMVVKELTKN
ncbi:MAG: UDP-N-acetylmuramoyl-tripeptide--D-alanyl-D-alanine ligase, partial [Patescibacteria group bacterium]